MKDEDRRLISEIYVKQHIRNRSAVLMSDFATRMENATRLIERGFIIQGRFYRFDTLQCSMAGMEVAKKQIEQIIRNQRRAIEAEVTQIPTRLLDFFVFDCLVDRSSWFATKEPYLFFDWRQLPLMDDRIWTQCAKLFSALEKYGLSMRTRNYVSTRGGQPREVEFAFPPETYSLLREISPSKVGLTVEESKHFRLAYVLSDIAPYISSVARPDVREFIWQKLNMSSLTETDLASMIAQLAKLGITSEWRGLLSEKMPFEIRDQTALKIRLDSSLVKPSVEELLKAQKIAAPASRLATQVTTSIEGSPLKMYEELYEQIVTIELVLRELIKQKLKTQFGEKWEDQIPKTIMGDWRKREKADFDEALEPEKELINYADFADYANIIRNFESLFRDVFPNNLRAVTELERINNIGRRRVMHFRTISNAVYENTMYSIKWVVNKLPRKE